MKNDAECILFDKTPVSHSSVYVEEINFETNIT